LGYIVFVALLGVFPWWVSFSIGLGAYMQVLALSAPCARTFFDKQLSFDAFSSLPKEEKALSVFSHLFHLIGLYGFCAYSAARRKTCTGA
jgi:hypothetical protein